MIQGTPNLLNARALLRSAEYPIGLRAAFGLSVDNNLLNQLTDQGEHDIAYALYPHRSNSKEALTAKRAYEFNYPLMPLFEQKHDGDLPKLYSFVSAEPENLILTTIKTAEDSEDIVLRFYETSGKDTTATIRMAEDFKAARETDLLENDTCDLFVQQRSIEMKTSKHEIKTIKLIT